MTLLGSDHSLLIRSKFRSVLQLRLQQRRTREQLAGQGIMPPLKSPTAFHEQRKGSERSKAGDFLKHKIRGRQEKSDLVSMHILQGSGTEGSAQAAQMKLKRARLASDLNHKIALRPGPMELVEKNIIPVDSAVKDAAMKVAQYPPGERSPKRLRSGRSGQVNHGKFLKQEDSYTFEEDSSSDSLSPGQPHSSESPGSACSSSEAKSSDSSSPPLGSAGQESQNRDHGGHVGSPSSQMSQEDCLPMMNSGQIPPPSAAPAVIKSKTSDKNRHKKPKDTKPKVKKLKYHQYIPPDQKVEKSPPPMDSAYARLLQQQQLFLQLQILSQQKQQQQQQQQQQRPQNFSFQPLQPPPPKQSNEQLPRNLAVPASSSVSPAKTSYSAQSSISAVKPGPLPSNLDDLKVSELRQQLRMRGLPVSGTKTALIERLRPFKDPSSGSPSSSSDIATMTFSVTPTGSLSSYHSPSSSSAIYQFCSSNSTPPISPASSDLSVGGSLPDSFSDVTMSSPQFTADEAPVAGLSGDCLPEAEGPDAEKDKMLVEKQKVIEELTWKLHQEQRQVEELKMQLHKRKRTHSQHDLRVPPQNSLHLQPPQLQQQRFFGMSIKQEHVAASCTLSSKQLQGPRGTCMDSLAHCGPGVLPNLGGPRCLDNPTSGSPAALSAYLSPQCSPQHSPIAKAAGSPQQSSLPSAPNSPYLLPVSSGAAPGKSHGHGRSPQQSGRPHAVQIPQKNPLQPGSCSFSSDQRSLPAVFPGPADGGFDRDQAKVKSPHVNQKQMTRSQQMDELLDVLIESGVSSGSSGVPLAKFHRHYEHLSPAQVPFERVPGAGDGHLEALMSSPMGRPADAVLLKMGAGEGQMEEASECFMGAHQEKLLANREMMETPLSPADNRVSPAAEAHGLSMSFSEAPWETMEWLDLTPPSSATSFSAAPPAGPSIFNTEFLDVADINLNSAMDLHLEQW